ncbi:energy-coupling factor ABC transporter ATP-binding protein [Archaeoglobus sulfaticallidus]|uniref:energy-coupling factor ABC transporter ATP-binding protein n=1 Tax=Archaeoglobus sulfaticallidus TaxID=1316941 RepID=UPI001F2961EA|nr:ABC transporter ATP-binding protein [Archaeoglobus sulfaticallidus]
MHLREVVVSAENVSYEYPDGTLAVKDFSAEIRDGERIVLLGPNGCGKSTLIMLLSGLVKPKTGKIRIFGVEPNRNNAEFLRRNIGVVFQNPDDFLFNPTVLEELLYTPSQLNIPYDEAVELARTHARKFGIDYLLEKPPFRLSGGEKKKVSIVCALMLDPKILFLDEPTANVDGKTRRKIVEILQKRNSTLIVATHELDIVPKIADRIILIGMDKKVKADGSLEILEDHGLLESAGVI